MIDEAFEFMSQGMTKTALAGHLLVNPDTVFRWLKDHPEFSEAVNIGLAKSQGSFIGDLKDGFWHVTEYDDRGKPTTGKSMNAQVAALYARNVYKWDQKDKEDTTNNFNFKLSYDPKNLKGDDE
jgi:hypothetical protein